MDIFHGCHKCMVPEQNYVLKVINKEWFWKIVIIIVLIDDVLRQKSVVLVDFSWFWRVLSISYKFNYLCKQPCLLTILVWDNNKMLVVLKKGYAAYLEYGSSKMHTVSLSRPQLFRKLCNSSCNLIFLKKPNYISLVDHSLSCQNWE